MKTQVSEQKRNDLAVVTRSLAPAALTNINLVGPIACEPQAMVKTGAISPGLEKVQRRIDAKESRRIERQLKSEERRRRLEQRRQQVDID